MQRRRRRRASLFAAAALLSVSQAHEWTSSRDCLASSCASDGALCLEDGESCVALTETKGEWRVALDDHKRLSFSQVQLPPQVQTLRLQGDGHVQLDARGRWTGERLAALLFIGLDLTNASLPALPETAPQAADRALRAGQVPCGLAADVAPPQDARAAK